MSKRLTFAIFAAIFMAISIVPRAVHATPPLPPPTDVIIDGVVTDKGAPAAGFKIAGSCFGKLWGNYVGFGTTDATGYYIIHTNTTLCPLGSSVDTRADQDGDGKFESSAFGVAAPHTTLNIILGTNIDVPEFSWIGGLVIASMGVTGIIFMRRHAAWRTA